MSAVYPVSVTGTVRMSDGTDVPFTADSTTSSRWGADTEHLAAAVDVCTAIEEELADTDPRLDEEFGL